MKKEYIFLIIIFLIGFFLRIYHLGTVPVSLHRDEAFLGYNAWSILKTGNDMTGVFLPLHFESFLYSPGGYSYFSIPFMFLFGLSPQSIRLASSVFGSLTIIALFFLTKELFREYKQKSLLALLSAFSLAILPWHIILSRTATENTLVTFFIVIAVWLFALWARKKRVIFIILSFACFFITFFIYQAPRAFLPIFIPFLVMLWWNFIKQQKRWILVSVLFIVTILVPLFFILHSKQLSLRIRTVSVFATQEQQLQIDEQTREEGVAHVPIVISRVFHNKLQAYGEKIWENYMAHLSYPFFFEDTIVPIRYSSPLISLLFLWELPLLVLGIWFIARYNMRLAILIIGWILIVPIGSALTFDDIPNIQRTLIMAPALCILIAFGYVACLAHLTNKKTRIAFVALSILLCAYSVASFFLQYFVHAGRYRPIYRQEGYEQLVNKVNALLPGYKKVVVTNQESAPAIFFLTYGSYDPQAYQQETKNSALRDFDRVNFGNYEFSTNRCPLNKKSINNLEKGEILYVNSALCDEENIPNSKLLDIIERPDGSNIFKIYSFDNT